jgi:hypothetical protein
MKTKSTSPSRGADQQQAKGGPLSSWTIKPQRSRSGARARNPDAGNLAIDVPRLGSV